MTVFTTLQTKTKGENSLTKKARKCTLQTRGGELTHRVSGFPDRHLAREDIKVFPRLAVIPELQESL